MSASVPAITYRSPISRADVSGAIPSVTDARYAVAAVPSSIAVARIAPITVVGHPIPIAVGWRIVIVIVIGNWRIAITVIAAITVIVAIAVATVAVRITVATRVIGSGERGTNDGTRGKPKPRTTPATTAVTPTAVAPTAITEGPSLSSG
jgi:hypothetical protein